MSSEDKSVREKQEEWEYIGNVWGWKFSFIGLAVIMFLFVVVYLKWNSLENKPENIFIPIVKEQVDTLKTNPK